MAKEITTSSVIKVMKELKESDYILVTGPNSPKIIKIVSIDNVNMDRYHWTKEYLEESYEFDGYHSPNIPKYKLKNG